MGCRHSSVDSSALSILPPQVRLPSTPSTLLSFIVKFVLFLSLQCEKRTKVTKKRPGLAHFLKKVEHIHQLIFRRRLIGDTFLIGPILKFHDRKITRFAEPVVSTFLIIRVHFHEISLNLEGVQFRYVKAKAAASKVLHRKGLPVWSNHQ